MNPNKWKKVKRSGAFKRKVQKRYLALQTTGLVTNEPKACCQDSQQNSNSGSVSHFYMDNSVNRGRLCDSENDDSVSQENEENNIVTGNTQETPINQTDIISLKNCCPSSESSDEEIENDGFRQNLKKWAIDFNIPQVALKELSKILNKRIPCVVPLDPRTLLKGNINISIIPIENGNYWHNGLIEKLKKLLEYIMHDIPKHISLNINIDGLPLYNSSKHQVWPILCNIHEKPIVPPVVVGIFEGTSKPPDLNAYLQPFIDELKELLGSGLKLITKETEMTVKVDIRAFICDSPARAFIKGVCNFNAKHGCLKCTTVGEYSYISRTVTFPKTGCVLRSDDDFRSRKYGDHHKKDSPLLQLPIDMIEHFPVGDSLHLIDLGIMKRLLFGWRDGNLGKLITKWCTRDIEKVSEFLLSCKMPKEIHRSIRSLNDLSHWKASEFRTFLLYLSFIILKDVLGDGPYNHFLCLFSAVTICTSKKHFDFLPLAEAMLKHFVDKYGEYYSKDYITSNVHNLTHLVDEVKRFGELQTFNAYPFENKLNSIKRTIRKGNQPLQQIAHRLTERYEIDLENVKNETENNSPRIKTYTYKNTTISVVQLKSFILSTDTRDKWFLSKNNDIVEVRSITCNNGLITFTGNSIRNYTDVFETPIRSSFLCIFMINELNIMHSEATYNITDIKCKLINVSHNGKCYFVPLIHTI